MHDSKGSTKNNQVPNPLFNNELQFQENLTRDYSHVLQHLKTPFCHKQEKSSQKKTGLMDPGTFKLVIEHQKEYSLPLSNLIPDKVTLNQKKNMGQFLAKTKS